MSDDQIWVHLRESFLPLIESLLLAIDGNDTSMVKERDFGTAIQYGQCKQSIHIYDGYSDITYV